MLGKNLGNFFSRGDEGPVRLLTVGWLISLVLVPAVVYILWTTYASYAALVNRDLKLQRLVGLVSHLNDELHKSVLMMSTIGSPEWEELYGKTQPQLDTALAEVALLARSAYEANYAARAKTAYSQLLETEELSMALARTKRIGEARKLISERRYKEARRSFEQSIRAMAENVEKRIDEDVRATRKRQFLGAVFGCASIVVSSLAWLGILIVIRAHLTERKRVEAELVEKITIIDQLYEHIIETGKAQVLADHTARVAHELRQPLVIIGGFARRMLKEGAAVTASMRDSHLEWLGIIIQEVQRLEKILTGLIDYTQRERVDLKPINPNSLIEDIVRISADRARDKRIRIQLNLSQEVGEILVDPERFQQVARNLISNAIEFAPEGELIKIDTGVSLPGEKARETVKLESEAYFQMRVYNTGAVMSAEDIKKIFDPFSTTKAYGVGLTLTLAKRIIEDHRGSISVKSDETGTIFTAWIPVTPAVGEYGAGSFSVQ
jgi:signal transduction histidine kinase